MNRWMEEAVGKLTAFCFGRVKAGVRERTLGGGSGC